jgi:antitoxin YefM
MIPTCTMFWHMGVSVMDAISYTDARNRLAKTMDKVNEDRAPVLITRQRGKPAVLISLEDFNSYEETAYLTRSPRNAARLRSAVRQLASGKGRARRLVK